MKRILSQTALAIITLIFFFTSGPASAAKSETSFMQISKLFTENGCSAEGIGKQVVRLTSNSKSKKDLLVYCQSECGANQCSYSIYSFQNVAYVYRGSFTGNYKVSKNKSSQYFDLVVTAGTAFGKSESKILKFNGVEYQ